MIYMIVNFRHKGLKVFFQDQDGRKLPADMLGKINDLLSALDAVDKVEEMERPYFRLHALKGSLKGYWSVTVRANWRIIFRFEKGNVYDVDLVDYH